MGFFKSTLAFIKFLALGFGMAMVWYDTGLSRGWIAHNFHLDKLFWNFSWIFAFTSAIVVLSFGAIITFPYSWHFVVTGGRRLAAVGDDTERKFYIGGICLLVAFLAANLWFFYEIDILSTYEKTHNWYITTAIVFAPDLLFLLANALEFIINSQGGESGGARGGKGRSYDN